MRFARRLDPVPEYLTARLNRLIAERRAAGRDVISLGVGDPDLPPSVAAREALAAAVRRDDVAHYPTNRGLPELREAVARFYDRRFGVTLDPETEVVPLLGAKEGLAHLALAQLDPGDVALVADPGYPVYVGGPLIAGAEPYGLPLLPERAFQPDLGAVPAAVRDRANLLILGYPNNPTGAVVEDDLFERLVAYGVPVCHDNAYSEITFDGYVAPSFLQTPGAREAGIELLSLSKAFSLPGWRIAFAVGNAAMVGNLLRLKTNVDSGMFTRPAVRRDRAAGHRSGRAHGAGRDLRPPPRSGVRRSRRGGPRGDAAARRHVRLAAGAGRRGIDGVLGAHPRRVRRGDLAGRRVRRGGRGIRAARPDRSRRTASRRPSAG